MLTEDQIKYLATIPDNQKVAVKPFNPRGLCVAKQIIADIKSVEPDLKVILLGSLPLGISGQEDIDIDAFCIKSEQPKHFDNFKKLFGDYRRLLYNVRSFYAGVLSVGETPVPIPNTAVKPHGGYNT